MDFIFFTVALYIVDKIAPFLVLENYNWFINLRHSLCAKFPKLEKAINDVFDFKPFSCGNCMFFWTFLLTLYARFDFTFSLITALICFIIRQKEID